MTDIEVRNAPDRGRYEAVIDGKVAGFSQYILSDGLITFTHTEVDDAYEGQGVGSTLVRESLDDVRAQGDRQVQPLCPFYRSYIQSNPAYVDLVYGAGARS